MLPAWMQQQDSNARYILAAVALFFVSKFPFFSSSPLSTFIYSNVITYQVRHRQRAHFQRVLAAEILVHQGVRLRQAVLAVVVVAAAAAMMEEAAVEADGAHRKSRRKEHLDDVEAGVVGRADASQNDEDEEDHLVHLRRQQNQLRIWDQNKG